MAIKKSSKFIPENNISLKGNIELSSDKSLSIRAVLFASIAYGISNLKIKNPGEDANTSLQAIQKLGIKVIKNDNSYTIFGQGIGYPETNKEIIIDCRNSGTTTRLLAPLVAGSKIKSRFIGDRSLSSRPYRLEFLKSFLMQITPTRQKYLPLSIKGNVNTIQADIEIEKESAQMVSAATLAGIMSYGKTSVIAPNNVRDHTTRLLKFLKYPIQCKVQKNKQKIIVSGRQFLKPLNNYIIPADPSSSAFLICIPILTKGSEIKIKNVCLNEHRIGFIKILKRMGAKIKFTNKRSYFGEPVGDIVASYSNLKGITIKPNEVAGCIDEIPVLAVVATFCSSKSLFNNLTELKFKESDRLKVIYENLKLCGVNIERKKDTLIIDGVSEKFYSNTIPVIKNYKKDHRIAMSFFVLSAVSRKKIQINDFECTNVSFPNFLKTIDNLKQRKEKKIILACDGGVACGKTSILKRIEKKYKSNAIFIDSGTLYRLLTLIHLKSGRKKIDADYLINKIRQINFRMLQSSKLHSNEVSNKVSEIAKIPKIRTALLPIQRDLVFNSPQKYVLVGGRDICAKILPGNFSDIKIFIDANVKLRAKRRYLQLINDKSEKSIDFNDVLRDLKMRDLIDKTRSTSPLKKTKDSLLITNNSNDISHPVKKIINLLERENKKH